LRVTFCVLLAAMGSTLVGAGASGAGMPVGGVVRLFVVPGNGQGNGTVVMAGAIGDYGKTTKLKNGLAKVVLHKGTFEVNLNAMTKALNSSKPMIENTTTCSFVVGATVPAPLLDGTGAYKDITGTLTLTEMFAGYGPLYTTGAKKGQCNTSMNATPTAQWGSVSGVGTVKFV
jgi:hypothetical protein